MKWPIPIPDEFAGSDRQPYSPAERNPNARRSNFGIRGHPAQHGSETYVELSEDMFEAPYPGQFNCRIKSVAIRFPGLVSAGLSSHAHLIRIANTRYATRECDPRRGGIRGENRYA